MVEHAEVLSNGYTKRQEVSKTENIRAEMGKEYKKEFEFWFKHFKHFIHHKT